MSSYESTCISAADFRDRDGSGRSPRPRRVLIPRMSVVCSKLAVDDFVAWLVAHCLSRLLELHWACSARRLSATWLAGRRKVFPKMPRDEKCRVPIRTFRGDVDCLGRKESHIMSCKFLSKALFIASVAGLLMSVAWA